MQVANGLPAMDDFELFRVRSLHGGGLDPSLCQHADEEPEPGGGSTVAAEGAVATYLKYLKFFDGQFENEDRCSVDSSDRHILFCEERPDQQSTAGFPTCVSDSKLRTNKRLLTSGPKQPRTSWANGISGPVQPNAERRTEPRREPAQGKTGCRKQPRRWFLRRFDRCQTEKTTVTGGCSDVTGAYRVRRFSTTGSTARVVNRGDFFRVRNRVHPTQTDWPVVVGFVDDEEQHRISASSAQQRLQSYEHHKDAEEEFAEHEDEEMDGEQNSDDDESRSLLDRRRHRFDLRPSRRQKTARPSKLGSNVSRRAVTTTPHVDSVRLRSLSTTRGHQAESGSTTCLDGQNTPVLSVVVLGARGVGKTTLARQLLTSEYLANTLQTGCSGQDDENSSTGNTVSVELDEEEFLVQIVETRGWQGNQLKSGPVNGYVVVYSVTDRASFAYASACLQALKRTTDPADNSSVILVANKQDLVRNRLVSEQDGRRLASKRGCKFIEISAFLDHRVDELLAGVVRQIRLRQLGCQHSGSSSPDSAISHSSQSVGLCQSVVCLWRHWTRRCLGRWTMSDLDSNCDDLFVL